MRESVRHLVVEQTLGESNVHPPAVFDAFVNACAEAEAALLGQAARFQPFDFTLVAGGDGAAAPAFDKDGYRYHRRARCHGLFISPRPNAAQMRAYLSDSPAAAFRRSSVYQAALRRWNVAQSQERLDLVRPFLGEGVVVDVEPRTTAFVEALARAGESRAGDSRAGESRAGATRAVIADPVYLARQDLHFPEGVCTLVDSPQALAREGAGLVCAFDALEHQHDPVGFLAALAAALAPGGALVLTTRSAAGFDIQTLGPRATIMPLEHLNLFTPETIEEVLDWLGLDIIEISTPGQLDVQIVDRVRREESGVELPGLIEYFLAHRSALARRKLQTFLQEECLSSHMRVIARKKRGGG